LVLLSAATFKDVSASVHNALLVIILFGLDSVNADIFEAVDNRSSIATRRGLVELEEKLLR